MDDSSLGGNKSKCVSEILSAPYSEQDNCHETGWWIKLKMIHLLMVLLSILKLSSSLFLENNCALTIPDISPSFHHLFNLCSVVLPSGIQIDKY